MAEMIRVVTVCGLGADLCTMPLVMCSFMLWLGLFPVPSQAVWAASPWSCVGAALILGAELAVDLFANKSPALALIWSRVSHVISMMVTVTVVHALGANLSMPERIAAVTTGLIATGVVKEGFDSVKGVIAQVWRA